MADDDLVQAFRAPGPVCEIVAGMLRTNGVECVVSSDDAGGNRPELGHALGSRVLVRRSDLAAARELIESYETADPS